VGGAGGDVFWQTMRRASSWRTDRGSELWIGFTDLSGELRAPDADVASLHVTCFNGDLPNRLPFGVDERGDFELLSGGPIQRILCVVTPTKAIQPALGKTLLWRMISSLSLNHLSLADGTPDALRELLRLHNVGNS
jgi:type VI secretion system protein ImpG